MTAFSYYPGCSLHGTAKEYDTSLKLVSRKLGLELREIPDWNCCGATAAHSTDEILGLALPARNLRLAAAAGLPVLAPCAMCFNRMKVTQHELDDGARRTKVEEMLGGTPLDPSVRRLEVLSLLNAFCGNEMLASIQSAVVKRLKNLKAVCYYGCLLVRPPAVVGSIDGDDPENPKSMDRLVEKLGAEVLDWPFKTECCGASLALARTDVVLTLGRRLLAMARAAGADCVVTACPMCHSNLDTRQRQIKKEFGDTLEMPVLYVTELMGLAFGFSPHELLIDRHLTDAMKLCKQVEA